MEQSVCITTLCNWNPIPRYNVIEMYTAKAGFFRIEIFQSDWGINSLWMFIHSLKDARHDSPKLVLNSGGTPLKLYVKAFAMVVAYMSFSF